jgi:hypothetical protein
MSEDHRDEADHLLEQLERVHRNLSQPATPQEHTALRLYLAHLLDEWRELWRWRRYRFETMVSNAAFHTQRGPIS